MESTPQPKTTNYDLALMLGELRGDVKVIKQTTDNLDHAINGNGKRGLLEDHRCLAEEYRQHILETEAFKKQVDAEKKAAIDKREKFSGRTWAIVLAIVGAFITQTVALISLFIRTGTIR